MSLKKHGGIWFVRIGCVGFNLYITRKRAHKPAPVRLLTFVPSDAAQS
jgi:hypothetical protein